MDSRTGESITADHAESSVFTWEGSNSLFSRIRFVENPMFTRTRIYHIEVRFNHNVRRALGLHKAYFNFQIWTTSMTASGRTYLSRFKFLVMSYLDSLGAIGINNVIRAVRFATDRHYVTDVLENHEIKYKFY
ncbi:rep-interacting protein [Capraria yellow spot Yucatan virus]|uniref:Replication enhancer n=1 Tax=Capraria yellow spot virus TaxID=2049955 RepID=R4JVP3_9GEMI|nr:rep-interacting protein [Capraria yellow spot Yucatan virus]AGK90270.1 rep-interacting protein [Capraria yellow spot Yucatan virus]